MWSDSVCIQASASDVSHFIVRGILNIVFGDYAYPKYHLLTTQRPRETGPGVRLSVVTGGVIQSDVSGIINQLTTTFIFCLFVRTVLFLFCFLF